MEEHASHLVYGKVDHARYSTDNNCISILLDFGKNRVEDDHLPREEVEEGKDEDFHGDIYDKALLLGSNKKMKDALLSFFSSQGSGKKGQGISKIIINRREMILSQRDTSQKQFTALKTSTGTYSALIFETGAVIVVGLQEPKLTKFCVTKVVNDIADTLAHPIRIRNVSIVNTVSTFNRFHLNFTRLSEFFNRHCVAYIYNPETFPGMFFKVRVPTRKLEKGETLGEYYAKVAAMRDNKQSTFVIKEWLRVKTVLTFKVGKNTVLGECGQDDVSVISKLLFGLFHYFMDHNIKLSSSEARRLRDRYGIPPLEWYLYVDMFFHSHPYVKPTRDEVKEAMVRNATLGTIDKTYYGISGEYPDSPLSANLLPSIQELEKVINAMSEQRLCGQRTLSRECTFVSNRPRGWWRTNRMRPDPFGLLYADSAFEPLAGGMNGKVVNEPGEWWLEKKFGPFLEELKGLCYEELIKECEEADLIPAAFIRNNLLTLTQERLMHAVAKKRRCKPFMGKNNISSGRDWAAGSRSRETECTRKKHSVRIARLETSVCVYKFMKREIMTGIAPSFANLLGTDVYSLLSMIKNLPKSRGHASLINNNLLRNSSSALKTPGDAYFSRILDETEKRPWTGPRSKRTSERSKLKCKACALAFEKDSLLTSTGLCEDCDEQSTRHIENALIEIRTGERTKTINAFQGELYHRPLGRDQENDGMETESRAKQVKCSASDFIDSIIEFEDELTGMPKIGLRLKVNDILNSLISSRGTEDRPTANYRTSLHTIMRNKSNLTKLLVTVLREGGASEDEIRLFEHVLGTEKGLSLLCELTRGGDTRGRESSETIV
uniref:Wsv303-like protein n=1 Tax=Metapenaeus ensis nimavirus TaxID=2133794 RepID=A0A401IPE8_9VIRU|nr:MAG: wsv303-like protein [Metapenaeus ensis nimavirus]GBG35494.1 wsv303-like protein [Metapenaeus ensis nimavirus]